MLHIKESKGQQPTLNIALSLKNKDTRKTNNTNLNFVYLQQLIVSIKECNFQEKFKFNVRPMVARFLQDNLN